MIRTVAMLSRRRRYCQQCGTGSGSCFQQPGRWFALYIREVVSNRVYHLISDYGGHEFSTSDRHACGIKSANFQKRGVLYNHKEVLTPDVRNRRLEELSARMRTVRRELNTCTDIETDAAALLLKWQEVRQAEKEEREVNENEQRRRSR